MAEEFKEGDWVFARRFKKGILKGQVVKIYENKSCDVRLDNGKTVNFSPNALSKLTDEDWERIRQAKRRQ